MFFVCPSLLLRTFGLPCICGVCPFDSFFFLMKSSFIYKIKGVERRFYVWSEDEGQR